MIHASGKAHLAVSWVWIYGEYSAICLKFWFQMLARFFSFLAAHPARLHTEMEPIWKRGIHEQFVSKSFKYGEAGGVR